MRRRSIVRRAVVAVGAGLLSFAYASPAYASGGDLDPTFGRDGKVRTDFGHSYDVAYSVAVQADGKIVVAGETASDRGSPMFAVARYNADGSLDSSFSNNGKRRTDFTEAEDVAFGVAIQDDGKILVAGTAAFDRDTSKFALARYNVDGSPDTTFSGDGKVTTAFTRRGDVGWGAIAIQDDGKIVAVGDAGVNGDHATFALARYRENGSLDPTFGRDGKVRTDFTRYPEDALAVAISDQGKIVVAGGSGFGQPRERFALARYRPGGSLDPTFGGDGRVTTNLAFGDDVAFGIALQADGKIVAAGGASQGEANAKWGLTRYNTDGELDSSFSGDGKVISDFTPYDDGAYVLRIQANGKLVAAGLAGFDGERGGMFALARYRENGSLDPRFGGDGKVTTDLTKGPDSAYGLAIQSNGRLVVAGQAGARNTDFAVARYLAR
jgi:uncharacterized delta-60 repeat protein